MENENREHKTPPKFIENFSLDIREEMNIKNSVQASPFRCMPNISTPPSRFFKIKNPFEAALNERLHLHIFSPSVFQEAKKTSDKFKWTIDDMSSIRPAPIDVSTVHQFETSPEDDVQVQAKIEKYFSETHTVPSPWNEYVKQEPLVSETSPCTTESTKEMCDGWTQTVLTLPPVLPTDVEEALKPYFTFTQDQSYDDKNTSLCRRLFHFQEEETTTYESLSPVHSDISCIGSPLLVPSQQVPGENFISSPSRPPIPTDISPISNSTPRKELEYSPISSRHLDCQLRSSQNSHKSIIKDRSLSPLLTRKFHRRSKSTSRIDYSENMSVDNSFNLTSENEPEHEYERSKYIESPLRVSEILDGSCNWEMEYNNLSLNNRSIRKSLFSTYKRSNSESSMDISHHTTPKSNKSYSNQRKKLSDSFRLFDSSDSEHERTENQSKVIRYDINEDCKSSKNEFLSQNTHDTGYNTCSELSQRTCSELSQRTCSELSQRTCSRNFDEEMLISDISSMNDNKENWNFVFASTPTKRKNGTSFV